jgi:hypothetical protein
MEYGSVLDVPNNGDFPVRKLWQQTGGHSIWYDLIPYHLDEPKLLWTITSQAAKDDLYTMFCGLPKINHAIIHAITYMKAHTHIYIYIYSIHDIPLLVVKSRHDLIVNRRRKALVTASSGMPCRENVARTVASGFADLVLVGMLKRPWYHSKEKSDHWHVWELRLVDCKLKLSDFCIFASNSHQISE